MGPLSGLRVTELAGLGPCPLAGQLLADLGARVVVIDRKSGVDLSRDVNRRGKQSIALDLKHDEGVEIALRLAERSDLLIEGYRPGVMERLGLGPDQCRTRNRKLVYGRMTGWGQEGPLSARAGHDINYLATTGVLHAMGDADRPPSPPLNLVADYGGGAMFLLLGVLSAIFAAGRTGEGQVVDAAMIDGVPAMLGIVHSMLASGAWTDKRQSNMLDGGAPYYRCYETADGKFVSVGALEPQFFAELVEILGLDRTWNARRTDRGAWPELHRALETVFRRKNRDEWAELFSASDACVAPVLDWHEAASFEHNMLRGVHFEAGGVAQAAPAPRFSETPSAPPRPAGKSGADNWPVLDLLGYGPREIEEFERRGVLA